MVEINLDYFILKKFPKKVCYNITLAKKERFRIDIQNKRKIALRNLNDIFNEKFVGIALDFDGTLIPIGKYDALVEKNILVKLQKINSKRIPIFILTGRGSSIYKQFPLKFFIFKEYIFIAQYNGGKIFLGESNCISEIKIKNINNYSKIQLFLKRNKIEFKEKVSSFVCLNNYKNFHSCRKYIEQLNDWKIVDTNYSFDIIPKKVSKLYALREGCKLFNISNLNSILKVGDAGDIHGNDYDFLKLKNSFSVYKFSNQINTNFPILNKKNTFLYGPEGLKFILKRIKLKQI